ncbi:MAG: VCBS repeat-containing protein, partial [Oscillospiraceae bacterium]|nr:VCBS repeat-containing protein [Oscillospiraceae bacterium]
NKNVYAIEDYVKYGKSTEFLYTSKNLKELIENGFNVISSQRFDVHLEKFGVVSFIPGFYDIAGQNYLMIYLIDSNVNILWNFQPMHDHGNFFSIKACSFIDIDGDGLKDIAILADYIDIDENGNAAHVTDFNIYYQEAGYFIEDTEFKNSYNFTNIDTLPDITQKARQFWGWE